MKMDTELDKVIMETRARLLAYELTNNDVPLKVVSRLIRKALTKLYGRENVKVRIEDYGWINIEARIERPHEGECMKPDGYSRIFECERCRNLIDATTADIWKVIDMSGLGKHLFLRAYFFNLYACGRYVPIRCYAKL